MFFLKQFHLFEKELRICFEMIKRLFDEKKISPKSFQAFIKEI